MEQDPSSTENTAATGIKKTLATIWSWVRIGGRFLIGALPAILVIGVALLLVFLGVKNLQVGGLLSTLMGGSKKPLGKAAVDLANSIPKNRVDANGKVIEKGVPDSQGITQATVVEIEAPSIFDDPKEIKYIPPGETKPVTIRLPDGVEASDVDKVVVVKPEITVVTVKDTSPVQINASDIDSLLLKYRKQQ